MASDVDRARQRDAVATTFGRSLRTCRIRARIGQEELGRRAGLHRTEISLLERGHREPRLSTVIKLADALDVSLSELLGEVRWSVEDGFACN